VRLLLSSGGHEFLPNQALCPTHSARSPYARRPISSLFRLWFPGSNRHKFLFLNESFKTTGRLRLIFYSMRVFGNFMDRIVQEDNGIQLDEFYHLSA